MIDALDRCRERPDPQQPDADRDGVTDACDPDDDDDGVFDDRDKCPFAADPDQLDADTDGRGAACDADDGAAPRARRDVTAPRVRVTLAAPPRLTVFGSSLPVTVGCSESCAVTAELVVGARDARRLGIRRGILAAGDAQLDARGTTYAFLRFDRRTLRALRRQATTRATLRVGARDRAGNDRTLRRAVMIRR